MPENKANENRGELPILQPPENNPTSLTRKSGRGRIRACVLILVQLVIVVHITHFYLLQVGPFHPLNPPRQCTRIELGHLNAGTIFFGLAIISTVVFGRFFCGWGCHIVALTGSVRIFVTANREFVPNRYEADCWHWCRLRLRFTCFFGRP